MGDALSRIDIGAARDLADRAFRTAGVPAPQAGDAAHVLTVAEAMGIRTHGLARVGQYIERIGAGGIDPSAEVTAEAVAPALFRLDGKGGLGPAIAEAARRAATGAAQRFGIGAALVRRGSHVGALAPYLLAAAEAGFAAVVVSNTAPMIAPSGGRAARVGNMPLGIGIPHPEGRHVLLDMSLSAVARSRIRAAAAAGEAIPADWATDAEGHPTTDPKVAMTGLLRAIGGDKGANLAVSLDLLVATLSGAAMLTEIPNAVADPGRAQALGQMIIVVDAGILGSAEERGARLDAAASIIGGTPALDPHTPPRLPGSGALARLARARSEGLNLAPGLLEELQALAGS